MIVREWVQAEEEKDFDETGKGTSCRTWNILPQRIDHAHSDIPDILRGDLQISFYRTEHFKAQGPSWKRWSLLD